MWLLKISVVIKKCLNLTDVSLSVFILFPDSLFVAQTKQAEDDESWNDRRWFFLVRFSKFWFVFARVISIDVISSLCSVCVLPLAGSVE